MIQAQVPRYRVQFVTGDYSARQTEANRLNAALYIEGHANSSSNPAADYAMCVVSTNASAASIALARRLAAAWGATLDVGGDRDTDIGYGNGVRIGGAGDANLRHTDMPAVLCEPCFASNPAQCRLVETSAGLALVAAPLVDAIRDTVPDGGLIAFSVGHIGKCSAPLDRGAAWRGQRYSTEAEFAAAYLTLAAQRLEHGDTAVAPRPTLTATVPRAPTAPAGASNPAAPAAAVSRETPAPLALDSGELAAAQAQPIAIHLHLHGSAGPSGTLA